MVSPCLVVLALVAAPASRAATFTVTSNGDDAHGYAAGTCPAPCTLRDALLAANTAPGPDTIAFALPGAGPHTIAPLTPLPDVTSTITIDGYTQPGARPNSLVVGGDAVLLIELSGNAADTTADTGLWIKAGGDGSAVRGLAVNRFAHNGLVIEGVHGVTVAGMFLGVDPTGTAAEHNGWSGLMLYDGAVDCTVGGPTVADRNVISGGLTIGNSTTTGIAVVGNYIGTDATGTKALGNSSGVTINSSSGNTVGGSAPGSGNVISGNLSAGVSIGNPSSGNVIAGNLIGTDATGAAPLGNRGAGIWLYDGFSGTATGNTIGGPQPGAGNVIAHNRDAGVVLSAFQGKYPLGNAIVGNSIHSNGGLAIDLGNDGVTANDPGDGDSGPNDLVNFPLIGTAARSGGALSIWGTIDAAPDTAFTLEIYANSACDPSGHGEAERLIGKVDVTTDAAGHAVLTATLAGVTARGEAVTATATDAAGNTSELSPCRTVGWGLRRILRAPS
jgi:titin